uniref:Uncharacterized protein n=1 Tax=Triticum urartu TaxID=4572 RepID=A0A8R7UT95_TRIUA
MQELHAWTPARLQTQGHAGSYEPARVHACRLGCRHRGMPARMNPRGCMHACMHACAGVSLRRALGSSWLPAAGTASSKERAAAARRTRRRGRVARRRSSTARAPARCCTTGAARGSSSAAASSWPAPAWASSAPEGTATARAACSPPTSAWHTGLHRPRRSRRRRLRTSGPEGAGETKAQADRARGP